MRLKYFISIYIISILTLLIFNFSKGYTENIPDVKYTIKPACPSEVDEIIIEVMGSWGNPGYTIQHNYSVSENTIVIDAVISQKPGIWAQVISDWVFTENLGKLSIGKYNLIINVTYKNSDQTNTITKTGEFNVYRDKIVVLDEVFTIKLEQALNPLYEWKCIEYDNNLIKLLYEGFKPPSTGLTGSTIKYFTFKAIKKGNTLLKFAYGKLDANGEFIQIDKEEGICLSVVSKRPQ